MEPLIARWDNAVTHRDPTDPTDETLLCCVTADGQPVALFLTDTQVADLRDQLAGDRKPLASHRPSRRRRSVLIRRTTT
ncbi:hypothetical protein KCMC57_64810 (plasmid) [Kitasatospora sp. CMC57]|uniref:Uncharacterized protein n=1 Tax=Kitasatospora sp. CMC57 TaxID=3231513 RepID=A0AB33K4I6_9ACTN